jgi:uncharacterized membrane protein YdjX (TVP38/TMEM64 family)
MNYKSATYDEKKESAAKNYTASINLQLHDHPQHQHQHEHQHPSEEHIVKEVFQFLVRRSWKKKLCTLLVVLSTIPVLLDILILRTGYISSNINNFLHWVMTHPILGVFAYIALLIATSLIFLPPSVLIFASGFIFTSIWPGFVGIIVALLASYIASTIGGLIGFVRAKYMTRDLVKVFMRRYPIVRAVDAAIVRNSLRVMILMRLNCLLPFGVINYVFGISGAKAEEFVLSMVGVVPWHLLLICLGASSASFVSFDFDMQNENNGVDEEGTSLVKGILMAMGVAFGLIGFAITWKFARKELQKVSDD